MRKGLIFSLIAMFCVVALFGADIYYAPSATGNGSGDDASNCRAFANFNPGFPQRDPGDNIIFTEGDYYVTAQNWMQSSGDPGNPITYTAHAVESNGIAGLQDDEYDVVTFHCNSIPDSSYAAVFWFPNRVGITMRYLNILDVRPNTDNRIFGIVFNNADGGSTTPPSDILIEKCTFTNLCSAAINISGDDTEGAINNVIIRDCVVENANTASNINGVQGMIIINDCGNVLIEGCTIKNGGVGGTDPNPSTGNWDECHWGGEGIYVTGESTDVVIRENIIYDLAKDKGTNYHYPAIRIVNSNATDISNNLIYNTSGGNVGRAIWISYNDPDNTTAVACTIYHNTIYNTGNDTVDGNAILIQGNDNYTVTNNILYLNDTDGIGDDTATNGGGTVTLGSNLTSDPGFWDEINYDFRLDPESTQSVDAGDDLSGTVDVDIEGNARPWFDGHDFGAFECIPIIDAGDAQNAFDTTGLNLTGVATADVPSGATTVNYTWSAVTDFEGVTADSTSLTWGTSNILNGVVNTFAVGGGTYGSPSVYLLQLQVDDGTNSITDVVQVDVYGIAVTNATATANGSETDIAMRLPTNTANMDVDVFAAGNITGYAWTVVFDSGDVTGTVFAASDPTLQNPVAVMDKVGSYTFTVTVTTDTPATIVDTINVAIQAAPKAASSSGGCAYDSTGGVSVTGILLAFAMLFTAMRLRKK